MRNALAERRSLPIALGLGGLVLIGALAVLAGGTAGAAVGGAAAADGPTADAPIAEPAVVDAATAQDDPERGPPAAGDAIEIEQTTRGNLFYDDETPEIVLDADGEVAWTVRDYYGRIVASDTESVDDETTLELPIEDVGHYALRVRPADGGPGSTARTTLAVLPAGGVENDDPFFAMSTKFGAGLDHGLMAQLDDIGVAAVRDEHGWHGVERTRGEYDFSGAHRRGFMTELLEREFDRLFLAVYGNELYAEEDHWEGTFTAPYDEKYRDGYADYTRAVLREYPELQHVEVWNEPNIESFSVGPAGQDPEAYTELLAATNDAVDDERPGATVVGGSATANYTGSVSLLDEQWWEGMLAAGGADHMDAMAVHLYRTEPTRFDRDVGRLRELTRDHNDGEDLPIWVTELGWHTSPHVVGGDLETRQSRHLIQSHTRLRALDVARYYWYTQVDTYYGDDPEWQGGDGSSQAGLLRSAENPLGEYTPKPALLSYAVTAEHLGDTEFQFREREPVEHHRFTPTKGAASTSGHRAGVSVLWADDRTDVTIATDESVTVASPTGREDTLEPVDGEVYLTVGPDPIFVEGTVDDVTEGAPVGLETTIASGSAGGDADGAGVAAVSYSNDGTSERTVEHEVGGETVTLTAAEGDADAATVDLTQAYGERAGVAVDVVRIDGQPVGRLEAPVGVPQARFGDRPFLTGMTVETMNPGQGRHFSEVNDVGTGHGAFEAATREDIGCYETDVEAGSHGRTLFVDLSDDHYHDVEGTVPVTVRYYDDSTGTFGLEYDDGTPSGAIAEPVALDGGGWETHTFELDDAALATPSGGLGGGGDHDLQVTLEGSLIGQSEGDVCFESVTVGTAPASSIDPDGRSDDGGGGVDGGAGEGDGDSSEDDSGDSADDDSGDDAGSDRRADGASESGGESADGLPGFGIGLALAGLAATALLARRQSD